MDARPTDREKLLPAKAHVAALGGPLTTDRVGPQLTPPSLLSRFPRVVGKIVSSKKLSRKCSASFAIKRPVTI